MTGFWQTGQTITASGLNICVNPYCISGVTKTFTTIYQNGEKPSFHSVMGNVTLGNGFMKIFVGPTSPPTNLVCFQDEDANRNINSFFVVPPYHYYSVSGSQVTKTGWIEYQ